MIFWKEEKHQIDYKDLVKIINGKLKLAHDASDSLSYFISLIIKVSGGVNIIDIDELIKIIFNNNNNNKFSLETSGTTTEPKPVHISVKNCIRQVKKSDAEFLSIWGLCYPERSFAATQVLFQALYNKETIVNLYNSSVSFSDISSMIHQYNVNRLCCTPTFLKMLCIASSEKYNHVKSVTVGGELLDDLVFKSFQDKFISAKLINIYASTEAGSLLYSNDNYFNIPIRLKSTLKIINNELVIHRSLLNEKNEYLKDWFFTGDMVEFKTGEESFKFIGRKSSVINIGGHRVNLNEVEKHICSISYVMDARVYSKKNSVLGNILCADVISFEKDVSKIKLDLKGFLPNFKIPTKINIKETIELTKTGKKIRK